MWFNLTSIIGLILSLFIYYLLLKMKDGMFVLRGIALSLAMFKIGEYVYRNFQGHYSYPVEISTITYFLFSFIVIFDIKRGFSVAAFYAVLSGAGFFIFYILFGSTASFYGEMSKHILAIISHGILLFGGLYLLKQYRFLEEDKKNILILIFMIIAHGSVFYIDSIKNETFMYYLIKPDFLDIFDILWANHLLKLGYYALLVVLFNQCINIFYFFNQAIHENETKKKTELVFED